MRGIEVAVASKFSTIEVLREVQLAHFKFRMFRQVHHVAFSPAPLFETLWPLRAVFLC